MRTNTKGKKGISLIVLVITIIVMIILAAAIILSISNSGIIGRSNEAKIKSDIKTMQEELQVLKANEALNGTDKDITITDLSSAKGYENKFTVQNGELRYLREGGLTKEEIAWAKEVGVKSTAIELVDGQNGVSISKDHVLTVVDPSAFTLEDVRIPDGVTSIGSFYGCTTLKSIELPDSVKSIGSFGHCTSLEYINIPNGVEKLEGTFYECYSLKSIELPDSITTLRGTFEECRSLKYVNLPKNLKILGDSTFLSCALKGDLIIPEGVISIDLRCFHGCSFSSITLPASLESVTYGAFEYCGCFALTINGEPRFGVDDIVAWFDLHDISDRNITITGSGYISD